MVKFDKLLCTPSAVLRCYLLSRFPEIDISGNEKGNLVRLQPWIVNGAKKNKYIRAYYSHNWQNKFTAIPCLSASMFYHWVTAFPSPYSRQAQRTCFMLRFSFTAERECTYLYLPLDYTHRNSSQITGKKGSGAFSFFIIWSLPLLAVWETQTDLFWAEFWGEQGNKFAIYNWHLHFRECDRELLYLNEIEKIYNKFEEGSLIRRHFQVVDMKTLNFLMEALEDECASLSGFIYSNWRHPINWASQFFIFVCRVKHVQEI